MSTLQPSLGGTDQAGVDVIESQPGLLAGLVEGGQGSTRQPLGRAVDGEDADAVLALTAVFDAGGDQDQVGDVAVQHEHLRAGQAPLVAAVDGGQLDSRGVPATVFLGEGEGADGLAARQARQVLLLRLLVTGQQQCVGGEHDAGEVRGTQQCAAHLLEHDAGLEERVAGASVLLGDREALQADLLAHLLPELGFVALDGLHEPSHLGLRRLVLQEAANRPAQLFLLVAESKVHAGHPRGVDCVALQGVPVRVHARAARCPAAARPKTSSGAAVGSINPWFWPGHGPPARSSWPPSRLIVETRPADFLRAAGRSARRLKDRCSAAGSGPVTVALRGGWFGWLGFEATATPCPARSASTRTSCGCPAECGGTRRWSGSCRTPIWSGDAHGCAPCWRARSDRGGLTGSDRSPPSRDRAEHTAAVERCIQHIRAGEIYQANICLTLRGGVQPGSPADLGADLLSATQPPYGAYLALGERQVASASPELFLRRSGRLVTSTPIKGTRPRTPATAEAERDSAGRLAEGPGRERHDRGSGTQRPVPGRRDRVGARQPSARRRARPPACGIW